MQLSELHADAAWQAQPQTEHDTSDPLMVEFVDERWPARVQPQIPLTATTAN